MQNWKFYFYRFTDLCCRIALFALTKTYLITNIKQRAPHQMHKRLSTNWLSLAYRNTLKQLFAYCDDHRSNVLFGIRDSASQRTTIQPEKKELLKSRGLKIHFKKQSNQNTFIFGHFFNKTQNNRHFIWIAFNFQNAFYMGTEKHSFCNSMNK